jgi:acyl carrier protein
MNESALEKELSELLSLILPRPVSITSSRATDPAWDSLKHMQIIFAIEERFGVRFTEEEIPQLDSFAKLVDYLRQSHASQLPP